MIMNKFTKRISKLKKHPNHAVVFGTAFGRLPEILPIFKTIFVFSNDPIIKSKNVVYRTDIADTKVLIEIDIIFIDLNLKSELYKMETIWNVNKSIVLVEGNDILGREFTKPLFNSNYSCTSQQGMYHVWEFQR